MMNSFGTTFWGKKFAVYPSGGRAMENRGQVIFGGLLVLLGLLFLIGVLFQIDIWALCWPVGLIIVGVWLLARPALGDAANRVVLLGDVRRSGVWNVGHQDYWLGIGDMDLDLTQASIPLGETIIRIYSFIADVDLTVPADVGVSASLSGFVTDAKMFGGKEDQFLTPYTYKTPGYEQSERKICLESIHFIAEVKARQI
jgi:hypothetical protein